jgi:hypothetical protein
VIDRGASEHPLRWDAQINDDNIIIQCMMNKVLKLGIVSCRLDVLDFLNKYCDQKLASDSSGLPGGFSGQRAWVRIFKKMGARQLLS